MPGLFRNSAGRTCGGIDTVDLMIGIALLLIVPFMVVAIGSAFKGRDEPDPGVSNNGTPANEAVVADEELMQLLWQSAERAYERNAKVILGKAEAVDEDDSRLRSTLRHMAALSLQNALSELTRLEAEVAKNPQQFGHYHQRLASMKRDVEADLKKAR